VSVGLTLSGPTAPVPPGIQLAAYRVVQEALTNAVRHAPGARALVLVECGPDRVRVTVSDTGARAPAPPSQGSGRGLIGLRERLALYDGTLVAGPDGAGYRVEALLPFAPTAVDAEREGAA
jgi:signal transduction histidine kinase